MFLMMAAKKICLWTFYTLATLSATGTTYQYISTKIDEHNYPAPGKMIDIGGHRLHMIEKGAEHQGPTVILDAGCGNFSLDWELVASHIAQYARVITYDRAGDGWSDENHIPRTCENMVEELRTLLKKANIPAPYILVGHSLGGMNVQLYASLYPDEVAGIILVDSSHADQLEKMSMLPLAPLQSKTSQTISLIASYCGAMRLALKLAGPRTPLPKELEAMRQSHVCTPKFMRTMCAYVNGFEPSYAQLKKSVTNFGSKPLIVITAGKKMTPEETGGFYTQQQINDAFNAWQELQKDLATKSSNAKQIIAERSGHMINYEQPEIIVEAVKEMVNENTRKQ